VISESWYYSPDLNPIELAFAKFKALLRKPPNATSKTCGARSAASPISTRRPNAATSLTMPVIQPDRKPL
jgi:hypothetical protein